MFGKLKIRGEERGFALPAAAAATGAAGGPTAAAAAALWPGVSPGTVVASPTTVA